jgi:hypothetical protein
LDLLFQPPIAREEFERFGDRMKGILPQLNTSGLDKVSTASPTSPVRVASYPL